MMKILAVSFYGTEIPMKRNMFQKVWDFLRGKKPATVARITKAMAAL